MTTKSNLPAFDVIAVNGEGDKARFIRIGAAWPAKGGEGFNLQLDALPIGNSLLLRPRKSASDDQEGGAR
jgi:hypothetical protein